MFLSILTVFTFSLSDALILHSIFSIIDLLIFNRFELITFLQCYNVLITCFLVWLIKNTTREQHAREQHCTRDFILYIWCQSCPQSRQINVFKVHPWKSSPTGSLDVAPQTVLMPKSNPQPTILTFSRAHHLNFILESSNGQIGSIKWDYTKLNFAKVSTQTQVLMVT